MRWSEPDKGLFARAGALIDNSVFNIQNARFKKYEMAYKRFEELPVWQASVDLALAAYV